MNIIVSVTSFFSQTKFIKLKAFPGLLWSELHRGYPFFQHPLFSTLTLFFQHFFEQFIFWLGTPFFNTRKILIRKLAKMDKKDQNMVQKHD